MLSAKQDYSSNPILIQAAHNALRKRIQREETDAVAMALRAGILADPWQADLLASNVREMILLCSRQAGKSTVSSVLAVHEAVYKPNSLILVLSPSLRQSQELFRKIKDIYKAITTPLTPKANEDSALQLSLANGSRIVALPGNEATIRGFSGVTLLIIDEAARVPDALFQAVRPMLAVSGGRLVLLSTPFGKRGFFFHSWSGGGDWKRVKITADQCPRIDPKWLQNEREMIGDFWYLQEYQCQFMETSDTVFSYADIQGAIDSTITPMFGGSIVRNN